jgi:hypothetical protein
MEYEKSRQTARKTQIEFPPMAPTDWMEWDLGWAVVPDFDLQAETVDAYRVPPYLPSSSSATARRTTEEQRTQAFNHHHRSDHNKSILHQRLPLFTPLGLIDGK